MKPFLLIALIGAFLLSANGQTGSRSDRKRKADVFSNENLTAELEQLKRMPPVRKARVRVALELLQDALETATVSTDQEEIAAVSHRADDAVDVAVTVLPNGVLKGAMISCKKSLADSFILRLAHQGGLAGSKRQINQKLEQIIIRYQLARIPSVERVAKVLDFGEFHIRVAKKGAFLSGIISEDPELQN